MEKKINQGSKEYKKLAIALVFFIFVVGAFSLYLAWPLLTGTTILLDTRPVDPFDIFRGQYMTIRYEIGNIPLIKEAAPGKDVFVLLKEDSGGVFRYDGASLTKPNQGVFIRGKVIENRGNETNVEYGIEQFFFERDAQVPNTNITVQAKVSSRGGARITNLLFNGKPVDIAYKQVTITS